MLACHYIKRQAVFKKVPSYKSSHKIYMPSIESMYGTSNPMFCRRKVHSSFFFTAGMTARLQNSKSDDLNLCSDPDQVQTQNACFCTYIKTWYPCPAVFLLISPSRHPSGFILKLYLYFVVQTHCASLIPRSPCSSREVS